MPLNRRNRVGLGLMAVVAITLLWVATSRGNNPAPTSSFYVETDLVTNNVETNERLVNPWGIAYLKRGPFWINDNGTGFSSVYFGDATPYFAVSIPPPGATSSAPTGIVSNDQRSHFDNDKFIFATEDGTISGWNPSHGLRAQLKVDHSGGGAVYKGLALGATRGGTFLFATNFKSGAIDVFDSNYGDVNSPGHEFRDPLLPDDYAPFGITNINGQLWVTYALRDASGRDDTAGPHHGFIDVFTTQGDLVGRFASGGALNSPWGMAVAPKNFGRFSRDLLVGNFGDGTINAYDMQTGAMTGQLADQDGNPIVIDGLWGLIFGNGGEAGSTSTLFFTAGPNRETSGLFGRLEARG